MYATLWRLIPGPVWLRILIVLVLVAAVLYLLAFFVFPWVDQMTAPAQDVTVDR
ncbi:MULTISPECIES: hypothetical protein [Herbiconiux]|jgi:hypothetical protein|uniref:DUF4175 domain-containing protein n=1 Tax=Herbiconiux flava TaxID=881268 RepID=A0A852SLY1_9MICO|nr:MULTISPECIES: hypothetical protein [Herbiconiux]NQX34812.1 hypothetical protein [Herbiconiux sp. VKM Ac-2851]NYD69619.1 hypothetical protein [Herbiconiux flava]GLK16366.1 hypothetical protein GCM10017602_08480 [Herbiconiux flava]